MELFIIIMLVATLAILLPTIIKHKKITNGIVNYDNNMRKFVYKVYLSRQEIITLLKSKNEIDELTCTFNDDETVIKISEYGSNRKYYFQVQELNGFSLLKLEQVSIIGMQSWVPFKLNPFLVEKLNAEIVPFSQYKF